jgi:hypothetical protein
MRMATLPFWALAIRAQGSGAEGKAKSSRASLLGPWGDLGDEEETRSSDPPKIDGKDSLLPAMHAEDYQSFNRDSMANNFSIDGRERALVSERHKFKSPNLSPKNDGEASGENNPGSGVTTDDEDDSSPPPALESSTEKVLDDIIEGTNAYSEFIRSGGVPENNEQWTSDLAKNLAEGTRRTKSPPGTPRSHELEEERARVRDTQVMALPLRIPLDLRLTEEELRRREMVKTFDETLDT